MNLFVLFAGLLWLGTIVALVLCLIVLLVTAYARKNRRLAVRAIVGTTGAMLAVTGAFLVLAYFWFRPYDPTSASDLEQAYMAEFGVLPPNGVTVLKARQIVVGDSGGQWLLLKATPEEIDRHIAMGFQKAAVAPPSFRGAVGGNAPKWWQPPTTNIELYENNTWSRSGGWHSSEATMGVDRTSNVIWLNASKWD